MSEKKTAAQRLAERRKAREKGAEARAEARAEQELLDLDALEALEDKHGHARVSQVPIEHVVGLPTILVVRAPTRHEMKRFRDMANGEGDSARLDAQMQLVESCLVYPDRETQAEVFEAFPTSKDMAANACILLAAGQRDARAKF